MTELLEDIAVNSSTKEKKNPIQCKTGSKTINGIHIDVNMMEFADQIFTVVTAHQKIGTLIHITSELAKVGEPNIVYRTKVILGVDTPEIHAFSLQIASKLPTSKSILLSLCFKEVPSAQFIKEVATFVSSVWTSDLLKG